MYFELNPFRRSVVGSLVSQVLHKAPVRTGGALSLLLLLSACGGGGGSGDGTTEPPVSHSISGTARAAVNSAADSDTNDPHAPAASNSEATTAQALVSPAIVGGFVTAAPTGNAGDRFAGAADIYDAFIVSLSANQVINLEIADPAADLDLHLLDPSGTPVASSAGDGQYESITVASGGTYYVAVEAFAGSSNYVLSIGTGSALAASPLNLAAEFVPGEVLVRLAPNRIGAQRAASAQAFAASVGMQLLGGAADRTMRLTLGDGAQRDRALAALGVATPRGMQGALAAAGVDDKLTTLRALKALRARADVASADLNYVHRPLLVPNDPHYGKQWHYPLINLPQAWDLTTGSPESGDVTVAVIDTGVFLAHPDLSDRLVDGYDFISDPAVSVDGDGIDANPDDAGDQATPGGSSWHGTHVAGTVAAGSNDGRGVAGVSWGARIMPVRVLGKGGGTSYDIVQSVRFAAGLSNDSGSVPARRADIINLSLGCLACYTDAEQAAYTAARNAGVIVIAAAGNEDTSVPGYPASYSGVVSVASVTMQKERSYFSNYGTHVDVAAPGGDTRVDSDGDGLADGILSTLVNESGGTPRASYGAYQGTSMAAPHMAGVVALMKAVNPALTPAALDSLLADGSITDDIGPSGWDEHFGHGLINAHKAVYRAKEMADSGSTPTVALVVDPPRLEFGNLIETRTIRAIKQGDAETALTVSGVSDSADWLSVAGAGVDGAGLGEYTVSVDRSGLQPGTYSASVTFNYSGGASGSLTVPVSLQVGEASSAGDAGYQWVLLLDEDFETVDQVSLGANGGDYPFAFSGLTEGATYYLVAGTDADNDGYVCDEGEACGAYPTLGLPESVTAGGEKTELDFSVGFASAVSLSSAGASGDAPRGFRLLDREMKEVAR